MRIIFLIAALFSAAPAMGQVSYPPYDASAVSRQAADAGQAAAVAAMPPVCTDKPASDTYAGTAGIAPACTPRSDASRATQYQGVGTVTDANGAFNITWPVPFASTPVVAYAAVYGQPSPYLCSVMTKSPTGATGQCWALTTTTLPSTATALLGLVTSPFKNAAANLVITVTGRQ